MDDRMSTSFPSAKGRMSCSTVSAVKTASSPSSCAWMSCARRATILDAVGGAQGNQKMLDLHDPLLFPVCNPPAPACGSSTFNSLWGAFLQAFTVEDVFQRKIK